MRPLGLIIAVVAPCFCSLQVQAFAPVLPLQISRASLSPLAAESEENPDVQCFVVNDDEVQLEGKKPHVVCTSDPEEYAWMEGMDPAKMKPTDGTEEGNLECVEGHPTRGSVEEYECKSE